MASILPDGVGTPYVALFNGSGQPLIDRVSGIPLSVFATSFNFEQKEGETKEVEITLKVPNGSIIDSREIGPYSPIKVKWGWIYPDGTYTYGPLWNLMVTGREISFTPQAVDISLKLSDRTILYKNAPSEFQKIMNDIFNPYSKFVYIDDVLIFSQNIDQHFEHLKTFIHIIKHLQT